jgi:hypothetical protein
MGQVPITGARGSISTSLATIYSAPESTSGNVYVTIQNISFTNTVDDDPFELTLYQNSGDSDSPTVLWNYKFASQAKTVVDSDVKKLLLGDSLLSVCDKSTVEYVINGYYEIE